MNHNIYLSFFVFLLIYLISGFDSPDEYIKEGDTFFIKGEHEKAIKFYTDAINLDSSYHRAYYKRSFVYYAMKNYHKSLFDLNLIINLDKDFFLAYDLRGKIFKETGAFEKAKNDFLTYIKLKPKDGDKYNKLVDEVQGLQQKFVESERYFDSKSYEMAANSYSTIIDLTPGFIEARFKRAISYYNLKRFPEVIEDTTRILKIQSNDVKALFLRGNTFKNMGQLDAAEAHYKQCLKSQSSNQDCKKQIEELSLFKSWLKTAENTVSSKPKTALENIENCLNYNIDFFIPQLSLLKCKALFHEKKINDAIDECQRAFDLDNHQTEALKFKGEAHLLKDEFDNAIRCFQRATELGDQSAHEGLNKAKKLEKMSKRKDYYKILGIEKTASEKEIKSAYRKLIFKYHPDKIKNVENEEEREKLQKLYYDVNDANEILTDPEKKGRYDRGEDLDERQGGPGFNPFSNMGGFNFGNVKFNWG